MKLGLGIPFCGRGGGGSPIGSAIYLVRSYDMTWADSTRALTGATNQIVGGITPDPLSVTGTLFGAPGHGVLKLADTVNFLQVAGLTGEGRHLAVAYRVLPFTSTSGMLLSTSASGTFLGAATSATGTSADAVATRGNVWLNETGYTGAMTRGDVWTGSEMADNDTPGTENDIKFFAYERPTWTSESFRPLHYSSAGFSVAAAIMGIAIFTDWSQRQAIQTALTANVAEAGYRYWRFRCTLNNGDGTGRVSMARLVFKNGAGTALSNAAGGVSSSYVKSRFPGQNPTNLFDDDNATFWTSLGSCATEDGEWVMYDFGADQDPAVASVDIRSTASNPTFAPDSFVIEKSLDGRNWTGVISQTGQTAWTAGGETRNFTV